MSRASLRSTLRKFKIRLQKAISWPYQRWVLRRDLQHVQGPLEFASSPDHILLFCIVRNGALYLPSFFRHYRALGVTHFLFFVDDSTDGTLELLKQEENTTLFNWRRPHSFPHYESILRRHFTYRYGRFKWTLSVDIDELYDYPLSDAMPLRGLTRYLEANEYNAVVGYSLDRFPDGALQEQTFDPVDDLAAAHPWYDLSGLKRAPYPLHKVRNTHLPHAEITDLSGGLRDAVFKSSPWLIRHPLARFDRAMKCRHHYIPGAHIADLSTVTYHFRFLADLPEVARHFMKSGISFNTIRYRHVVEAFEKGEPIVLRRESSRKLESVNQLVDEGFLCVSQAYRDWVQAWSNPPANADIQA